MQISFFTYNALNLERILKSKSSRFKSNAKIIQLLLYLDGD